jgi:hypothetical protein
LTAPVGILAEADGHGIGLSETVSLTEKRREYHCTFVAKDLAATNMIPFQVGERTGPVWIADVAVSRSVQAGVAEPGVWQTGLLHGSLEVFTGQPRLSRIEFPEPERSRSEHLKLGLDSHARKIAP